jgi:ubiquinone biosynthesis protein UbiJ
VKNLFGFGQRAGETTLRNTAEYFAHESRDLVPRAEADVFLNGVDRVREDMDRLEARFAALEASLAPPADADK